VHSAPDDLKANVGRIESIVNNPSAPNQVVIFTHFLLSFNSNVVQKLLDILYKKK